MSAQGSETDEILENSERYRDARAAESQDPETGKTPIPLDNAEDALSFELSREIDKVVGPPGLAPGEDLAEFRRLEGIFAEEHYRPGKAINSVDIRNWTAAQWAARRYGRARDQVLREALHSQVRAVLPDDGKLDAMLKAFDRGDRTQLGKA